jgi:glycosyltransferase involved in cell wall biosynthesis
MSGFEENEVSVNSNGGTELSKRSIAARIPEELSSQFQVIPSRLREIAEDKIRIYWVHDLAEDPEVQHLKDENDRNKFHKIVFVSHWQMQDFILKLGIPYTDQLCVIENPIEPFVLREKPSDKINLIYFSTPHRGLDLLIPAFDSIAKKYDNVHLNVYSSFKLYGWDEMDKQFEPLYEKIRNHPSMTYHGYVPQDQLREALLDSHILAFPSTWPETSCRVLIESMSAGLMCVHPNLAALSETSASLTSMYQFIQDPSTHANMFYQYLDNACRVANTPELISYTKFVKAYADTRFNITKISNQWEHLMKELLAKYPTEESRKVPSKMFIYRTS